MLVSRLLLLSMMVSVPAVSAAAQTAAPAAVPQQLSPAPEPGQIRVPALQGHSQVVIIPSDGSARLYAAAPAPEALDRLLQGKRVTRGNGQVCYSIRDYQFRQENPGSDATTFSGSSTCRPTKSIHLKPIAPALAR